MARNSVPLHTKLLYGAGEIALSAKNSALNQFLLFFYVDVAHLGPAGVSAALFIGRLWDAITDPVVGYLSDTTRSPWGRRRPFVALSAVPVGIAFYFLFAPPAWSGTILLVYLTGAYLMLMTLFTCLATPYLAWGAELTQDYHERTVVVQIRSLFGVVGGLLGAVAPVAIAQRAAEPRSGYALMAAVLGAVISASALATAFGVRESRAVTAPIPSVSHFVAGLRHTFVNRGFRIVFMTFCLMTIAAALGQSVQLFVIKYWLDLYDFFPQIAFSFAMSFALSFPLWQGLSRRIGKRRAMLWGLALGSVAPLGWLLLEPGNHLRVIVFTIFGGAATGSITLVLSSVIDIVDFDEWETGERREGAYFGFWTLGLKSMGALGTLLSGVILDGVGFVPGAAVDERTVWWLLMVVGPLQSVSYAIGFFAMRRFRFEASDVGRIQDALALRRAAANAEKPR